MSRHLSNVTLEGGPSNLQLFFFFPLPETLCLSSEPQGWRDKNGKRPVRKAGACIFHGLAHVRPALAACPLLPPRRSFIMPSHTHTRSEGRSAAHVSLLCGELLGERRRLGPLHNQLVPLCPKYLICINFIAACFILSALN